MEIAFEVMGDCIPQSRPKAHNIAGHAVLYDPTRNKDYKNYIKLAAAQAMGNAPLMERPLKLKIIVRRPIPKGFSKSKITAALSGAILPAVRPDIDNFFKSISDAMIGVVFRDDNQICHLDIWKAYGEKPMICVAVKEI